MSQFRILDYNYIFDASVGLTASSENANFPVTNLRKFHRSKVWRTTSTTSQNLVVDLRTSEEIDSFVMVFDKEAMLAFSAGAVFTLEGNHLNTWGSPAVSVTPTFDAALGIVSYFWSTAQEYRYWRLSFSDSAASLGYFEISKIFLGKATQLNQMPEIGVVQGSEDRSRIEQNDYGHEYADTYPQRDSLLCTWVALSDADRATLREIYRRLGKVKPLFVSLDPLQATFVDKDELIYYGYLENDFEATQAFYTYFDAEMQIREAM